MDKATGIYIYCILSSILNKKFLKGWTSGITWPTWIFLLVTTIPSSSAVPIVSLLLPQLWNHGYSPIKIVTVVAHCFWSFFFILALKFFGIHSFIQLCFILFSHLCYSASCRTRHSWFHSIQDVSFGAFILTLNQKPPFAGLRFPRWIFQFSFMHFCHGFLYDFSFIQWRYRFFLLSINCLLFVSFTKAGSIIMSFLLMNFN